MMVTLFDEEKIMKAHDKTVLEQGRSQGFEQGRSQGFEQGRSQGFEQGRSQGFEQGKSQGISQGVVAGIVKMCKRYNGTIQEAVDQVMEELEYDEETATEAVKKYW